MSPALPTYTQSQVMAGRSIANEPLAHGSAVDEEELDDLEQVAKQRQRRLSSLVSIKNMSLGLIGLGGKQPLGPMDNLFYMMEEPSWHATCASLYTFKDELSIDSVEKVFLRLVMEYPRYRQVLRDSGSVFKLPYFESPDSFDVSRHIELRHLKNGSNDTTALNGFIGDFLSRDWNLDRPLWEAALVTNYHGEDGARSAIVVRGHHILADGQGFVRSMLMSLSSAKQMILKAEQAELEKLKKSKLEAKKKPVHLKNLPAIGNAIAPLDAHVPSSLKRPVFNVLNFAITALFICLFTIQHALHIGVRMLVSRPKSTYYKGPRSKSREFSYSKSVKMSDIKRIQNVFGEAIGTHVSLNDVMCAIVSRAVAPSFPLDKTLTLFIPISVREPGDWRLINLASGSQAWFDVRPNMTMEEQIQQSHEEMKLMKRSEIAKIYYTFVETVYRLPIFFPSTNSLIYRWVMQGLHGVLTNVPGPPIPISLDGHEIVTYTALPPPAGRGSIAMGMISYNGRFSISVATDKVHGREGQAAAICHRFNKVFEEYVEEAKRRQAETSNGHAE